MAHVRLITRWRRHAADEVIEIEDYVAKTLIDHDIAELADPPSHEAMAGEVECMAVEAPERAVLARPRKRQRVSRKGAKAQSTDKDEAQDVGE